MIVYHNLLQPYEPTVADPFDAVKANHLLDRAGFGGTAEEVQRVIEIGPQAAVEELLAFPDASAEEQNPDDLPDFSMIDGYPKTYRALQMQLRNLDEDHKRELRQQFMQANRRVLIATSNWWLKRMAYGPHPLQEKLALFWHGHFTTSAKDERAALIMWRQNELLRANAAGNFEKFVRAISRDVAMLDYLNNAQNKKQHPNENYARELMELFTLGIGNYTEDDVKQGARAFTGWSHDQDDFVFRPYEHDYGVKTFLGHVGYFDGDDIISIILQQPACPRFITGELFSMLAYENPDPTLAQALAQLLVASNYELRPLLRCILTSKAFYSPQCIGAQIKSPVQLVVGTIRKLHLAMPPALAMTAALTQMGQVPFEPPNVRGWPGGRMWINTSTLFVRYNTGVWLTGGSVPAMSLGRTFGGGLGGMGGEGPIAQRLRERSIVEFTPQVDTGDSPEQVVDAWVQRLIGRAINPEQRQVLVTALGDDPRQEQNLQKMVQLIVSMPDYQLC